MDIRLARIYDEKDKGGGYRVLVDRVWPQGVSKEEAGLDEWKKHVAPSDDLRKWFGHDPKRWQEFRNRYLSELAEHREELRELAERAEEEPVVLLYGAKDTERNNAVVLKQYLEMLEDG